MDVLTADGESRIHASLAVAADGVRSTVRQLLGIPVRLKEYPDRYLMGDFADSTAFGPDAALFLEAAGIVESFPLPGRVRRWVARMPGSRRGRANCPRPWPRIVQERTGVAVDAGTNSMLSSFGVRPRLAKRMVHGRTALIGDAAHEISPIGGQGMNLGWLDAAELVPLLLRRLARTERGAGTAVALNVTGCGRPRRLPGSPKSTWRWAGRCPVPLWPARNRLIGYAAGVPAINSRVAARFTMH